MIHYNRDDFSFSQHYNLKASTIAHVVNIISNVRIGKSEGRCVQKNSDKYNKRTYL